MCYVVTGFVNKLALTDSFADICTKYNRSVKPIRNIIENTIPSENICPFRITGRPNWDCDCGTSLGSKVVKDDLKDYLSFLKEIQGCPKVEYIGIFKHMYKGSFDEIIVAKLKIIKIHISEIDVDYLANIEDDIIYIILYYKKHNQVEL